MFAQIKQLDFINNFTLSKCLLVGILLFSISSLELNAQEVVPDDILDIFDNSCAFTGCHSGPASPKDLDLSEEFVLAVTVNQPSEEKPDFMRVKPGDPENSYLIMKIKGSPGIEGEQMPRGSKFLTPDEISAIESWIKILPVGLKVEVTKKEYIQAFPGLSLATLPTTQTLRTGSFSYRIAHRWRGEVIDSGFANFFGLDAGAHMLTQLAFPINDNIMVSMARSSESATFEFAAKWRFLSETTDGSMPISAALRAGVDWATSKNLAGVSKTLSRVDGQRLNWFAQIALSKQIKKRIAVLLVPGVLINGNVQMTDEKPLFTVGLAGKFMITNGLSVFIEGVPLFIGDEDAVPVGGARNNNGELIFNDSFTIGVEQKVGGHVFHVYITNSLGLATNQYMSGGNLDFAEGDFRLGFNIYRVLRLPF